MRNLISFILLLIATTAFAQKEFHVFPVNGKNIKGASSGNGSLDKPWDLQTALSQPSERVNGGDIIWLHAGIYTGRFHSVLKSSNSELITVSAYTKDKVILNGNVESNAGQVLKVTGNNVVFKNFDITHLGDYSRAKTDKDFRASAGIFHTSGFGKFQNLRIYNNPGLGFGSWKSTKGSIIEDCLIYYNGFSGEKRGEGEGMYVQNKSDDLRIIRNNIIFNNYYKGVEVWSASSGHGYEFVKNVELSDNIFFNNGEPSGINRDNLIVATNDNQGVNIAKNIKVKRNVFYHNIDFNDSKNYGYGTSLAVGYRVKALVEDILITDNVLLGRNNPLNLMYIESLEFRNNIVYGGSVNFHKTSIPAIEAGRFKLDYNKYYTRKVDAYRIIDYKNYNFSNWQNTFNVDKKSTRQSLASFQIKPVLKVSPLITNPNIFNVALLDKEGDNVVVDFSAYNIEGGMSYQIIDIENSAVVIKSGTVSTSKQIEFPMGLKAYEMPLHNTISTKSAVNFGVYRIEFSTNKKKRSLLDRLFGWLF